ncbi:MAG TPA: signal peptidase II [Gemmatimonadales bacterium]|jgi:signal peptidase II|nr:signal peptidase II [Gemmatimonadales bacterium]
MLTLRKARWFWPVFATLLLADCSTKELVVSALGTNPGPHAVIGDLLRFTLAYNPDAALNLSFGSASRLVFGGIALFALAVLFRLYQRTASDAVLRAVALALVAAGALGNLLDRIRSARGVVDFIDVGVGDVRFWTFNVADMGVSVGAVLLALVLWREDQAKEAA